MQYYFDIRDGDELMPDEEGLDLWSIDRVQQEAAKTLADLVKDAALELNSGSGRCADWQSRFDGVPPCAPSSCRWRWAETQHS